MSRPTVYNNTSDTFRAIPEDIMGQPINLTVFRFAVSLLHKSFADIPDDKLRFQPNAAMNPPIWILGHLVGTLGYIPKILGDQLACPPEYLTWFGPGSKIEDLPAALPSKKEMLSKLSEISERILSLVPNVPEANWSKANPTPFFQAELPTLRDITENLLVGHTMLHVGQLTVWRRMHELPRIIAIPPQ